MILFVLFQNVPKKNQGSTKLVLLSSMEFENVWIAIAPLSKMPLKLLPKLTSELFMLNTCFVMFLGVFHAFLKIVLVFCVYLCR